MTAPRVRSLALLFAFLGCSVVSVAAVHAQELLPPRVTTRKFPQSTFCPIPIEMSFVANGAAATLRFSTTTVNYSNFDGVNTEPRWAHQSIDNICVVPDNVYLANRGPLAGSARDCYIGAQVTETFYFHTAGTIPLKEDFATEPSAAGWDISHGAYWYPTRTAPNDPQAGTGLVPLGCLGLGLDNPPYALTDSAFTTKHVTGLTSGVTYRLTGWWAVEDMQLDKISLTVVVLGDNVVPIARTTWGGLKRRYQ